MRRGQFSILLAVMVLASSQSANAKVVLELFVVSPAAEAAVHYERLTAPLSKRTGDPDTVARQLVKSICEPAILHSTSWRWEKDGTLILTYLAFSEEQRCLLREQKSILKADLLPRETTDPLKPRPDALRERDVLAHGLRHITFLMRYSSDDRIRKAVSDKALHFFQGLCGQLAGRYESAKEFSDCTIPRASDSSNSMPPR